MQIAIIFSALFNAMFPLLIMLFGIGIIMYIVAPKWMNKIFGSATPEREVETEEVKGLNVCYSCSEIFDEADAFCGNCGWKV